MSYWERIQSISDFSIENIIEQCRQNVPLNYKHCPYRYPEINHGVELLKSDVALDCYMMAYGEMHYSKCRVALQNFPFKHWDNMKSQVSLGGTIEIVDWGCGQGVGSMSIIEALQDRGLIQWLRKVTLIEPSKKSLDRAKCNVRKATNNNIFIQDINKFLPGNNNKEQLIQGLNYEFRNVIHIFSNILDVEGIDLAKVAQMVVTSNNNHYILCVGPMNANAFKIERFYEIFGTPSTFSDVSLKLFAYTSDTHHPYTCKTKCFMYDGSNLNLSRYNPTEKAENPIYDEYDINLYISNGAISYDKAWVYYRLINVLCQDDLIYIAPELNGAKPDFVIIRPNYGIVIVDVFEQDLCDIAINETGAEKELSSPISTLSDYQDILIGSIPELAEAVIENSRNLGLVKKLLICSKVSTEEARFFFAGKERYTKIYGKEFLENERESSKLYSDLRLVYKTNYFNIRVVNRLVRMLSPNWHSYREGKSIHLTNIQSSLAISEARMQKIRGVAGSGKTQVMCTRAINAQARTGGKVLILTYNITLINYLKIRLSEIRADFYWDNINLDYYHRFFRRNASQYDLFVGFNSYYETNFFEPVKEKTERYDAIFIDEVQDYATDWLDILKRYFLIDGGEFVVFGDPSQNIYNREIDVNGDIRLGIIPGVWNNSLTKSQRYSNPILRRLINCFKEYFGLSINNKNDNDNDNEDISSTGLSFNYVRYSYIEYNEDFKTIVSNVIEQIREHINNMEQANDLKNGDITIISSDIEILQEIEDCYNSVNEETIKTFVPKSKLEIIGHHNRISSSNEYVPYAFERDYKRYERMLKLSFTTDNDKKKISTIQSFKGWESSTIFLIIMKDKEFDRDLLFNSPHLIYTGLTRAKENLVIINIGNERYNNFFKENI